MSGFEVVGLIGNADAGADREDAPVHLQELGSGDQLYEIAARERVARVVVAVDERRKSLPVKQLLNCRMTGIEFEKEHIDDFKNAGLSFKRSAQIRQ